VKYKEAEKKFDFVKRLNLSDDKLKQKVFANLLGILKGSENKYITPLGKSADPIELLVDWTIIVNANKHKLNAPLLAIELEQRSKFGPRSQALPWVDRKPGLVRSFKNQIDDFNPPWYDFNDGKEDMAPLGVTETLEKVKRNTNSGLPRLTTKGKAIDNCIENFDDLLKRKDPCMLYTRTAESYKTRNVWGYPLADIFYEMMFFVPFLAHMREKFWQASIVSPELVDVRLTSIILTAIQCGKCLYSVDFKEFDASVSWQTIVRAFKYIKSTFDPLFHEPLDYICERFYTIGIVTPTGILRGKHGVPSGSCFTNLVDSLVQAATALSNDFIKECEMMVNGDDGVYIMFRDEIPKFEATFKQARLKLGKDKVHIADDWCTYCQRFYHIDYIKDGLIGGIYPTFRALNRLVWLEAFTDFNSKVKPGEKRISSKDHFGIRTLTILEQCKYHPLFEDLVRFILEREKFALDISNEGITAYAQALSKGRISDEEDLNVPDGTNFVGIRSFESYKIVQKIISEEGYFDIVDLDALNEDKEVDNIIE